MNKVYTKQKSKPIIHTIPIKTHSMDGIKYTIPSYFNKSIGFVQGSYKNNKHSITRI